MEAEGKEFKASLGYIRLEKGWGGGGGNRKKKKERLKENENKTKFLGSHSGGEKLQTKP